MTVSPDDQCVICQTTLARVFPYDAIVCPSLVCQWKLSVLPKNRRCVICTRPLSDVQMSAGLCARLTCRHRWANTGIIGNARTELRRISERATARRGRSAAQQGIPRDEVETYRVAVIPRNRNRIAKLPAKRRNVFETYLRSIIADARAHLAASTDPDVVSTLTEPQWTAPTPEILEAERALLGQGCATCRGACCAAGKNHAFVRVDTIVPYLQGNPTHDDDTIVARYLSYVGERTMTGGCLFQEETGCSLPRDLRGNVCNRYHCSGLEGLRNRFGVDDPVRAYFVHREGHELSGGAFIQISVGSKT